MSGISLRGITKRYGSTSVLDGLDLDVEDGEFLVLLGPSGCGKTTLLRILAGLVAPTDGRVIIGDEDVTDVGARKRDIAMVFQSYALYPHLTVARNLGFGLSVRRVGRETIERKVRDVAAQLRLTPLLARRPRELSGGQRQRVAVGRAMVRDPKAFLMDEPLSNLDAQLRHATRLELSALHRQLGTTFVYVTHDQVEAMTMGTRIALLNNGRLEQVGTPEEIYDRPASSFVAGFMGAPPMNLLDAELVSRDGVIHAVADGLDAPVHEGDLERRAVVLGIRPEHLVPTTTDDALLRGTVTAVENLGSEEIAVVRTGAGAVSLRRPRPLGLRAGDEVALTAPRERLHLFSAETTRRLEWVDDAPDAETDADDAPLERVAQPA
jgi:multiple sugar transport system ATP-binding protein